MARGPAGPGDNREDSDCEGLPQVTYDDLHSAAPVLPTLSVPSPEFQRIQELALAHKFRGSRRRVCIARHAERDPLHPQPLPNQSML